MPSKRRKRNYRREYARRKARALEQGYRSYWHKRQVEKESKRFGGNERRRFVEFGKSYNKRKDRELWDEGVEALRSGDFDLADDIAEQLGYIGDASTPARSLFYYHDG